MELLLSQIKTSDDVRKYAKEIFDEGGLDIPDTVIDRAHQIGPEYSDYKTKSVRLLLWDLQRSGIERWSSGQGKKSETMLKYV